MECHRGWYLSASGIILIASGLVLKRVRSGSPDAFRYHQNASGLPPRSTLGTNPLCISKIAHDFKYLHVRPMSLLRGFPEASRLVCLFCGAAIFDMSTCHSLFSEFFMPKYAFFRNFRESYSKICIVQNIFHIFASPVQCVFGRCVLRKKT